MQPTINQPKIHATEHTGSKGSHPACSSTAVPITNSASSPNVCNVHPKCLHPNRSNRVHDSKASSIASPTAPQQQHTLHLSSVAAPSAVAERWTAGQREDDVRKRHHHAAHHHPHLGIAPPQRALQPPRLATKRERRLLRPPHGTRAQACWASARERCAHRLGSASSTADRALKGCLSMCKSTPVFKKQQAASPQPSAAEAEAPSLTSTPHQSSNTPPSPTMTLLPNMLV